MSDKIIIEKESTSPILEEKIVIRVEREEVDRYIKLLKKTWPSTRIRTERYA